MQFIPQTYVGTKTVVAGEMSRGAYNLYRGWTIPADENPEDEGYLVEYLDGGKANHPSHQHYISWSPKDVFDRAYKPVEAPKYAQPHQQRVWEEQQQLWTRLTALRAFVLTDIFFALPHDERVDLKTQLLTMQDLNEILVRRINRFPRTL